MESNQARGAGRRCAHYGRRLGKGRLHQLEAAEGRRASRNSNLRCHEGVLGSVQERSVGATKETQIERTRRLFYVCCTCTITELAVIQVTQDVAAAEQAVRNMNLFRRIRYLQRRR